jgi:hypothetical protein
MSDAFGLIDFDWGKPLSEDERDAMLEKVIAVIRKWRLEVPAVLFLESSAPLGHAAGQGLVAFSPFVAPLLAGGLGGVQKLHALLEDPKNLERLIERLTEEHETETDAARK